MIILIPKYDVALLLKTFQRHLMSSNLRSKQLSMAHNVLHDKVILTTSPQNFFSVLWASQCPSHPWLRMWYGLCLEHSFHLTNSDRLPSGCRIRCVSAEPVPPSHSTYLSPVLSLVAKSAFAHWTKFYSICDYLHLVHHCGPNQGYCPQPKEVAQKAPACIIPRSFLPSPVWIFGKHLFT